MFKKKFSPFTLIILCLVCALAASVTVILLGVSYVGGRDGVDAVAKYATVRHILQNRYIGDIDPEAMDDAVYSAMVESIDDRWSYYMTADEYESYKLYVKNQYSGIGVTIQQDEETGGLLVVSVTEASPAEAAGIVAGDIMTAINGEDLTGKTTGDVRDIIQAAEGTEISVTLLRADGTTATVAVTPGMVYTSPVTSELLDGDIGYIRIKNFEEGCADAAIAAIDGLRDQGAKSIIFDVRSNPGGLVSQLTKLLDYILPEGDIFVSCNKAGKESVTRSDAACVELPMAVLFNADSYSAAEFFAAALKEYDWAVTVGEQSTGKGRSQITINLADGSAVHISTNVYLTPDRVDLSKVGGLTPDYPVENSTENDAQLQKAIEILS